MNEDNDLLRAYVRQQDQEAFTRLVQRHIGLVYSTALRRVRLDSHLAEDVTQTVFTDLARKAASLSDHAALVGWLYVGAQRAAAAAVRRESRRKHRELAAQSMPATDSPSEPSADPARLRPVIDEAILTLRPDEREAVIQRFFQQRSYAEIGAALRVTEEAARKRTDRALDKLQSALVRRGVTSTSAALGLALNAAGAAAVPAGLAAKVAAHAVAQAGTVSVAASLASALWPAAAVLVVGALFLVPTMRSHRALAAEIAQLSTRNLAIPALQHGNRRLAAAIVECRDLEAAAAELPALRAAHAAITPPAVPPPAPQGVTITTEGSIRWNGEFITLNDYLANVRAIHDATPGGESRLVIHAPGARFMQMIWAFDEARKAGIRHLVVESDAPVEPFAPVAWF